MYSAPEQLACRATLLPSSFAAACDAPAARSLIPNNHVLLAVVKHMLMWNTCLDWWGPRAAAAHPAPHLVVHISRQEDDTLPQKIVIQVHESLGAADKEGTEMQGMAGVKGTARNCNGQAALACMVAEGSSAHFSK